MSIVLTVNMERQDEVYLDDQGFLSHDKKQNKVAKFCHAHGIPYSDNFVSVGVSNSDSRRSSYLYGYGPVTIYLKDKVVSELSVVCVGDFHDTAVNGYKQTTQIRQQVYIRKFHDLTELTPTQKIEILQRIALSGNSTYIEARIFRAITKEDIAYQKDNSLIGLLINQGTDSYT